MGRSRGTLTQCRNLMGSLNGLIFQLLKSCYYRLRFSYLMITVCSYSIDANVTHLIRAGRAKWSQASERSFALNGCSSNWMEMFIAHWWGQASILFNGQALKKGEEFRYLSQCFRAMGTSMQRSSTELGQVRPSGDRPVEFLAINWCSATRMENSIEQWWGQSVGQSARSRNRECR